MRRVRTAVLLSGRGSNMEALVAAARDPAYPAEIALVLSDKPDAGGLAVARAAGIAAEAVAAKPFGKDREAHERALQARLEAHGTELVALAGYMRVLTPWLVERWRGRMLNIHPSLLPHFPGLDTHARAIAAGHAVAGCSVHLVTEELDAGPVLGRAEVAVLPGATSAALAAMLRAGERTKFLAFAWSLSHNSSDADDLVQETLIKAWTNRDKFEPGTNLRAWLFTILRNTYYTAVVKRRREVADEEGRHAATLVEEPSQEWSVAVHALRAALAKLPDEHREALVLVGAAGLSYEEAAVICNCALGTIKSRVNRARARLLKLMDVGAAADTLAGALGAPATARTD